MPAFKEKTIYIKSESGRVETFEAFRKKLSRLATSEQIRFREVRNLLKKEVQPLVNAARKEAYRDVEGGRGKHKKNRSGKVEFYNLYNSIGKWANKGTRSAYVTMGIRSPHKKGAIYALSQLAGAGPGMSKNGKRVGVSRRFKHIESKPGRTYRIQPKDFIDKALSSTDVIAKAQKRMQKHIEKRIKAVLR
jgi:hypothetical protein